LKILGPVQRVDLRLPQSLLVAMASVAAGIVLLVAMRIPKNSLSKRTWQSTLWDGRAAKCAI